MPFDLSKIPQQPAPKKTEPPPQLTSREVERLKPLLRARIPVDDGPGCFLCKWIHEDLEKNGNLTGHPKGNEGGQFPERAKMNHLKLEGMIP
jgi:hypothetical protein